MKLLGEWLRPGLPGLPACRIFLLVLPGVFSLLVLPAAVCQGSYACLALLAGICMALAAQPPGLAAPPPEAKNSILIAMPFRPPARPALPAPQVRARQDPHLCEQPGAVRQPLPRPAQGGGEWGGAALYIHGKR